MTALGEAEAQAAYLQHFRADSIVHDAVRGLAAPLSLLPSRAPPSSSPRADREGGECRS